jgi:hypothetical protein
MASRRATPTIAFLAPPVVAASLRYLWDAISSPATNLQAASTRTVRSRALPNLSNPPSRRAVPLFFRSNRPSFPSKMVDWAF